MAGRIVNDNINRSKSVGLLSPKALALFCLLIPRYNVYGKMNGDPGYIKSEICPRVEWLTIKAIRAALTEISEKTDVKWFEHDGLHYLHALKFADHNPNIRKDRAGPDRLPDYSGTDPGQVLGNKKEKEKKKEKENMGGIAFEILNYLNQRAGRHFEPTEANLSLIHQRLLELPEPKPGEYPKVERMKLMIDLMVGKWKDDPKMREYLRPNTLFNREKGNAYIGQIPRAPKKPRVFGKAEKEPSEEEVARARAESKKIAQGGKSRV